MTVWVQPTPSIWAVGSPSAEAVTGLAGVTVAGFESARATGAASTTHPNARSSPTAPASTRFGAAANDPRMLYPRFAISYTPVAGRTMPNAKRDGRAVDRG